MAEQALTVSPQVALNAIVGVVALQQAIAADHHREVALLLSQVQQLGTELARLRADYDVVRSDREKHMRAHSEAESRVGATSQQLVKEAVEAIALRIDQIGRGALIDEKTTTQKRLAELFNDLRQGKIIKVEG